MVSTLNDGYSQAMLITSHWLSVAVLVGACYLAPHLIRPTLALVVALTNANEMKCSIELYPGWTPEE